MCQPLYVPMCVWCQLCSQAPPSPHCWGTAPRKPRGKVWKQSEKWHFSESTEVSCINQRLQWCPAAAQSPARGQQSCHRLYNRGMISKTRPWRGHTVGITAVGVLSDAQLKTKFCFLMCKLLWKSKSLHICNFCMPFNNNYNKCLFFRKQQEWGP